MARRGSADVGFLLVDGYNLLGVATMVEDTVEALLEDVTVLGDQWAQLQYVGLQRAQLSQEGFFDDAAGGAHDALSGKQGVSRLLCYGLQGNIVGRRFTGYRGAMQVDYRRVVTRGQLHKANASYQGNGEVEEGVILHAVTPETAASGSTEGTGPVDNGMSTTGGGSAYLQVPQLALGGYTSATVKVRHSADNVTYADLVTFANVTAAPAAQRLDVPGAVQRYLAVSWQFNGSGSGQSITPFVGFVRK